MKRICKGSEPKLLAQYRSKVPSGTWEQMRNDALHGGRKAYEKCRSQSVGDQKGLCGYCEIDIRDNDPLKCRVEHFHSKADSSTDHNWALDWNNMLATCNGGSNRNVHASGFFRAPLAENLSCDAHKDQLITNGKLPLACEGWILSPHQIAAFPALFRVESHTGKLLPNPEGCAPGKAKAFPGNKHATVAALVQHTIWALNLNCIRLCKARLLLVQDLGRKKLKLKGRGMSASAANASLAQHCLGQQWPGFFSTIRSSLGAAAEKYLNNAAFRG